MVSVSDAGKGKRVRKMTDGRWVRTIVLIKPMRFASDTAKIVPRLEKTQAAELIVPSSRSSTPNLRFRKNVISDVATMPLPRESTPNRPQSLRTVNRDFGESVVTVARLVAGARLANSGCCCPSSFAASVSGASSGGAGGSGSHCRLKRRLIAVFKSPITA